MYFFKLTFMYADKCHDKKYDTIDVCMYKGIEVKIV